MPNRTQPQWTKLIRGNIPAGLVEVSREILREDFRKGHLNEVIRILVKNDSEVEAALKGMETGMGYAFALVLAGQIDLRLLQAENTG